MTEQLVPPAPSTVPGPSGPAHGPSRSGTTIAILTAVLGAAVALAIFGAAVVSAIVSASTRTETHAVAAAGIDELDIDVSAGSLRLAFDDVAEATLDVSEAWIGGGWTLERIDGALVVRSPEWAFGAAWLFSADARATLTLPRSLERTALDARFILAAGDLDATGRFGQLDLELGAGSVSVSGEAREVVVDVSAGRAELDLSGVQSAELALSAGQLEGRFAGTQPRFVDIDVSAGALEVTLPEGRYDVSSNISAGQLENRLDTSASSSHRVAVELSAGRVDLRSGR